MPMVYDYKIKICISRLCNQTETNMNHGYLEISETVILFWISSVFEELGRNDGLGDDTNRVSSKIPGCSGVLRLSSGQERLSKLLSVESISESSRKKQILLHLF